LIAAGTIAMVSNRYLLPSQADQGIPAQLNSKEG
jgi:hypothetical protein